MYKSIYLLTYSLVALKTVYQ